MNVCTSCDETIDRASDWDEQSQRCIPCFEVSGAAMYCCGVMYEHGEYSCMSCGDPL